MGKLSVIQRLHSLRKRCGNPPRLDTGTEGRLSLMLDAVRKLSEIYAGKRLAPHWVAYQDEISNMIRMYRYAPRVSAPALTKSRQKATKASVVLALALLRGVRFLKHERKHSEDAENLLAHLEGNVSYFGYGKPSPTVNEPRI